MFELPGFTVSGSRFNGWKIVLIAESAGIVESVKALGDRQWAMGYGKQTSR
jgi:hypothetical protein